jgi:hypothetical protein
VTDRRAWLVLLVLGTAALVAATRVRVDGFWGDAATYHGMAWSLAEDFDIRYEARDILRVRREVGGGPEGVFLKRASGGLTPDDVHGFPFLRRVRPEEQRIYYAKPFLYPLFAAPFVRVFGTAGLFLVNGLAFAAALLMGYAACRRDRDPGAALALTLAIALGTTVPVYVIWLAPEMFYFGLAAVALACWRLDRPIVAAVLMGAAAFAKPPHVFLAIPLLLAPLVADSPWTDRLLESIRRGLALAVTIVLLFAWNIAFTGEWNFQSGERKTFYGSFPFELKDGHEVRFGNSGSWATTSVVGPEADSDEVVETPRTEPPRPAWELRDSFIRNLGYFWIGRFGGAVPYFLPVVVAALLYLVAALRRRPGLWAIGAVVVVYAVDVLCIPASWYGGGQVVKLTLLACYLVPLVVAALGLSLANPEDRQGGLALCALLATFVFYIWFIPDDWYGNGNVGNRYFVPLVPLALYFAPRRRELVVAAAAVCSAVVLLRPILLSPLYHSDSSERPRPPADRPQTHTPAAQTTRATYRVFPIELTMLNDIAIFGDRWRKKQAYGDVGDEHKKWPAEPTAYFLYFPDDGTYGRESLAGAEGFWLRGGERAEVLLRAFDVKPIRRIRFAVTGGPAGDEVSIRAEGRQETLGVGSGESKAAVFEAGRGFGYKETFVYVLNLRSRRGGADALGRALGSFVRITLEVDGPKR